MSRAGQIMISHLNGNFRTNAARRTDSLTSLRTTKVPTAPMLTTPNFASCLAMSAGRHRFALPTFTARRNTTQGIRSKATRDRGLGRENTFALVAIRDSRIVGHWGMSFQTRRKIARRKRRSSVSPTKSLSERLYDWRKRNDLSQSEAALKLQISRRTLQEWEQGRAEPRHLASDALTVLLAQ